MPVGEPFLIRPARPGRGAQPFRPRTPTLPPGAFTSWEITPWWRRATCAEVNCGHWAHGWTTTVDTGTRLGRDQADYIRARSGRSFTETRPAPGQVAFHFPAGQTCFASATHRTQADREELYVARGGDWRARTGPARQYRPDQWADEFHTQSSRITTARSRAGTAE